MYMALVQQFPRLGHCEFVEVEAEDIDTSNLDVHDIPEDTKQQLLVDRYPGPPSLYPSDHLNGDVLLQDLRHLAPNVAKDFFPKSPIQDELVLRLINEREIGFGQQRYEVEDSYIALSYCWTRAQRETKEVEQGSIGDLPFGWVRTVERFPLPTSGAMFQAVLSERKDEREGLWFDQVCIEQEDDSEKAVAIGAMDLIYKNARAVIVAMDDIAVPDDEATFLRHYIHHYTSSELPPNQQPNRGLMPPYMQQHPLLRTFLERVLGSCWFERAWCVYEMEMARSHIFLVPCMFNDEEDDSYTFIRFTSAFFLHMLILMNEIAADQHPSRSPQIRRLLQFFSVRALQDHYSAVASHSPGTKVPSLPETTSFVPTVTEVFGLKASGNSRFPEYLRRLDANRDKTSIALNTSRMPLALKPSTPLQRPCIEDECLRQLLLVGIAAKDPVSLCTTGPPLQLHDGSISWLCRPTTLDNPSPSITLAHFQSKGGPITQASDGQAEFVQLDLIFLDLPHRTSPNPQFPAHIQRARSFIDTCLQYGIESSSTWTSWQTPSHPRAPAMKNIFIQTLACCFECGPNWLLDISNSLTQATSPSSPTNPLLSPHLISTLLNPSFILPNFLLVDQARASLSQLLALLGSLISRGIPWSSGATERTHGPMIVHSPASSPYASPQSPLTPAGKAMIFAPFEHSKTLLVTVPEVVKDGAYEALYRGWIITPRSQYMESTGMGRGGGSGVGSGTVSWTLQTKSVVFGERGFNVALASTSGHGVRNHRVFGPGRGR